LQSLGDMYPATMTVFQLANLEKKPFPDTLTNTEEALLGSVADTLREVEAKLRVFESQTTPLLPELLPNLASFYETLKENSSTSVCTNLGLFLLFLMLDFR